MNVYLVVCNGFQFIYAAIDEAKKKENFDENTKQIFGGYKITHIRFNQYAERGNTVLERFVSSLVQLPLEGWNLFLEWREYSVVVTQSLFFVGSLFVLFRLRKSFPIRPRVPWNTKRKHSVNFKDWNGSLQT